MNPHRGRSRCSRQVRSFVPPAALAVLAVLALACSEGPTDSSFYPADPAFHHNPGHGGGPGGGDDGGSTSPTGTVTITTSILGAGIYPNSDTAVYDAAFNGVDLHLRAPCDRGLAIRLDLTGQGLGPKFDQVREDCGDSSPRLIVERLLEVTSTTPVLLWSDYTDGSTNYGEAHNYYFHVDGVEHDVVWRAGLYAYVTDNGDGTSTYTVSTGSDLADDAEVWYRADKGKPRQLLLGSAVANLDLQVTVSN